MDDYSDMKTVISTQVTVADRQRLDEMHRKTGATRSKIMSMALREWLDSRDGPIPLPEFGPVKTTYADVKEPVLVLPLAMIEGAAAAKDGQ